MKNIVLSVVLFAIIIVESCMIINEIKANKEVEIETESNFYPCVLQDAVKHDNCWYLFDKPVVFDEESSYIMYKILEEDSIHVPVAALAELIDDCYVIHLN